MLQVDKALCIKQLLDNVIIWDMKDQRVMDIFKMSGDTELVAFATRYKPKQVSNLFSWLKTETKTPEEIRNEIIAKMSVDNELSTRYCEYKLFFTYLYTNFVNTLFSVRPPVAGLQAPLPDPIARLKLLSGKQLSSKMSVAAKTGPSMGKDPDLTASVVKPPLASAKRLNLTLLANGTVSTAKKGVYKKNVIVEEVEESDLEDDPHSYEINPETKTENRTPVSEYGLTVVCWTKYLSCRS
jgi:hypothetical protein